LCHFSQAKTLRFSFWKGALPCGTASDERRTVRKAPPPPALHQSSSISPKHASTPLRRISNSSHNTTEILVELFVYRVAAFASSLQITCFSFTIVYTSSLCPISDAAIRTQPLPLLGHEQALTAAKPSWQQSHLIAFRILIPTPEDCHDTAAVTVCYPLAFTCIPNKLELLPLTRPLPSSSAGQISFHYCCTWVCLPQINAR
jgi:hypothetical protein